MSKKGQKTGPISYDSMEQASAAMHIPKSELQRHKSNGAPGFRGARVYPDELKPYLLTVETRLETDPNDKRAWECKRLRLQCERLEDENERERVHHLTEDEHRQVIASMVSTIQSSIYALAPVLPPDLAGNSLADMERKLSAAFDGCFEKLKDVAAG